MVNFKTFTMIWITRIKYRIYYKNILKLGPRKQKLIMKNEIKPEIKQI